MKKLALLLAVVMLFSVVGVSATAEDAAIKESASGFWYVEANGDQPRLSAADKSLFIQADGLYFKDLNKNGAVDPYEDYRLPVDERVADLISKMTIQERAATLGFAGIAGQNGVVAADVNNDEILYSEEPFTSQTISAYGNVSNLASMTYQIKTAHASTFIAAMTGYPADQLDLLNKLQAIGEETPLGIPLVFSGDRSYNTWGGMIDMPHYAFGVAHDEQLLYDLVSEYAKESVALGYHQVFHGYGNEIGSFYGDDPAYIAKMAATETRAYEDNGFNSHSKHFIARGGRNSYSAAKSPADLIDSWKIGWKAVVDAGTPYIMTNNSVGVTPGLITFFDKDTYSILRDELGYEGVICLDWPMDASSILSQTGVTSDGIDISTLTLGERYTLILDVGIDMFSCGTVLPGTSLDDWPQAWMRYMPDVLIAEIEAGKYTEEAMNVHVARVIKNKFDLGIFENPYRDWQDALNVFASDAYKAEQFELMTNEDINRARRDTITKLEEELMVKSTILLKNDGVLPLKADAKVYVESNNNVIKPADIAAIGEKAAIVETLAEADVAVVHVTSFDDAYELFLEDAADAKVPVVLIFEGTNSSEPGAAQFMDANALLMQTYNNTPDHGSSTGSFYRYVTPAITAQMLFGEKSPAGSTLFELGYDSDAITLSWGELQNDIGVTDAVRLYMAMLAKENPAINMPNNLGDVICTTNYGMNYDKPADIALSLLTVPRAVAQVETESNGSKSVQTSVVNAAPKAGEAFPINFVAKNNGGDGHVTVQVKDGETVIAEKIVCLDEGQFRVITMDITLEAGEHTISVGDMTAVVTIQ